MRKGIRSVTLAMAVASAVAVAACGGGDGQQRFATSEVVDAFREQAGMRLVRDSEYSNETWDQLDIDGDADSAWGHWSLYVVKDGGTATLLEGEDGADLEPDDAGLYWQQEDDGVDPYWTVSKRYGDNVVLSYVGWSSRAESLDEGFDRVDTALSTALG